MFEATLLVRFEISELYVKPLAPNTRYSHHNNGKNRNPFKCIYLKNQKLFSETLFHFSESTWNLEHFEKDVESHSVSLYDIIDCEKRGY